MKFIYTNYKGETEERDIDVTALSYIPAPRFGYEPGWFLTGRDRSRNGQMRSFRFDGRMIPTAGDTAERMGQGLSMVEYPITEGHYVREAVDKIADRVEHELSQSSMPMHQRKP